jgi:hypothetical protein
MIKSLRKLEIKGMYLNIIKAIYDKTLANITFNGGKTETISSKGVHSLPSYSTYFWNS